MRIVTLNKAAFFEACKGLIHKIDDKPNIVMGILNGGGFMYPAIREIEYYKHLNFYNIRLERTGFLKNYKNFFKPVLQLLPYIVLNRLRAYEFFRIRKSINNLRIDELDNLKINLDFEDDFKKEITKILIIDDAIDSGATMFVVKNNIRKMFPGAEIKVAVISWTLDDSIVIPDYYLYKNTLVRYPWSIDYKERDF